MKNAVNKLAAAAAAAFVVLSVCVRLINAHGDEEVYDRIAAHKCKQQTRLTTFYLDCSAQQMQHTIAEWPNDAHAPNITRIVAYFNHNGMQTIAALPATDVDVLLSYARNRITTLADAIFLNCANISTLDLSYNQLKSDALITNVFRGPYSERKYAPIALRALNLAHNGLHTIGRNVFEHLTHLAWLDLSGNRFRIVDPLTALSFQNLPNLDYLNLANNRMIHLNETTLNGLRRLRTLDISGNALDFVPDAIKGVARTLTTLRIDNNPIIDLAEEHFQGMDYLVELSASNLSRLEEVKTCAFRSLTHLRRVDLSLIAGNAVIGDHLFGNSVRELNLSHASIEILSPHLVRWSQLTDVDLRGNQLYCTCDLHNITLQLQAAITRNRDGPFCFDYKRYKQYAVHTLTDDICFESEEYFNYSSSIFTSERIVRMTLLTACVILIVCVFVAGWVAYTRCYARRRSSSYPFSATVVYNPLSSHS